MSASKGKAFIGNASNRQQSVAENSVLESWYDSSISLARNSDLISNQKYSEYDLRDADGNNIDQALARLRQRRGSPRSSVVDPLLDAASTNYSKLQTECSVNSSANRSEVQPNPFITQNVVAEPFTQQSSSEIIQVPLADGLVYNEPHSFSIDDNVSIMAIRNVALQSSSNTASDLASNYASKSISYSSASNSDKNESIEIDGVAAKRPCPKNRIKQHSMQSEPFYVGGDFDSDSNGTDSLLAIRKKSFRRKHADESLTSITGVLSRDSTDILASTELSINDKKVIRERFHVPERSQTAGGINDARRRSSIQSEHATAPRMRKR
jgi:hypothetical protein